MSLQTPETTKKLILLKLKEEVTRLEGGTAYGALAEGACLIEIIRTAIRMVDGEEIRVSEVSPQNKIGILFLALGFNRLEFARLIKDGGLTIDADTAISFVKGKYAKHVTDRDGTYHFLNSLFANEIEKVKFAICLSTSCLTS